MKTDNIKRILFIIGDHIVFSVLSLFMITSLLNLVIKDGIPRIIFTVLIGFLYLSSVYCYSWNNSAKDYRMYKNMIKNSNTENVKYNIYAGFLHGVGIFALNIVLIILAFSFSRIAGIVFKCLNFAFFGFVVKSNGKISLTGSILVALLPFVTSGLGYIAGKYYFSILGKYLPKLIYKKK